MRSAWDESKLTLQAVKMKLIEEYDRKSSMHTNKSIAEKSAERTKDMKYQFWNEKGHEKPQFNKFIESRERIGLTMLAKTKGCFKNEFSNKTYEYNWCIDSGATRHICSRSQVPVRLVGKARYFATFVDVKSEYTEAVFLKNKSEVVTKFIEYIGKLKMQIGKNPKIVKLFTN